MFTSNEEILTTVVASTGLLFFMAMIIIIALIKYQQRRRDHLLEMESLKNAYRQEILKAQLEMKEQTLNLIAQEIHDNIGQVLSLAKLNLTTMIGRNQVVALDKIQSSKELVGKAIQDLRNLSRTLNGELITKIDLHDSLTAELGLMRKNELYKTQLAITGKQHFIEPPKQLILFRIIQEALQNIIKHAQATTIGLSLDYTDAQLTITLTDNGVGFENEIPQRGSGLLNMEYRAKLIGAICKIDSIVNKGTRLIIKLPNEQINSPSYDR